MQSRATVGVFCADSSCGCQTVQLKSQVLACEGVSLGGLLPASRCIVLLHLEAQTAKGGCVLMVHV